MTQTRRWWKTKGESTKSKKTSLNISKLQEERIFNDIIAKDKLHKWTDCNQEEWKDIYFQSTNLKGKKLAQINIIPLDQMFEPPFSFLHIPNCHKWGLVRDGLIKEKTLSKFFKIHKRKTFKITVSWVSLEV